VQSSLDGEEDRRVSRGIGVAFAQGRWRRWALSARKQGRWSMDGLFVQIAAAAVLFVGVVGVVWYYGPRRFQR
jgi:hypothetical protein